MSDDNRVSVMADVKQTCCYVPCSELSHMVPPQTLIKVIKRAANQPLNMMEKVHLFNLYGQGQMLGALNRQRKLVALQHSPYSML